MGSEGREGGRGKGWGNSLSKFDHVFERSAEADMWRWETSLLQPREARMYHSDTWRGEPSCRLTPKSIASSPERSSVATRGFYTSPALKVALNPLYTVVELLLLLNWTQTMFPWLCIELGFVLPHRRLVRIGPYSPDIDLGSPSTTYASRNST